MNDILNKIQAIQQEMRTTKDAHDKLLASVRELREQYEALLAEKLTPEVFTRVTDWLKDPQRKPAANAFTAGMERQIAFALELDVLPHVKRMEIRVAKAERLLTDAQSLCNHDPKHLPRINEHIHRALGLLRGNTSTN